MPSQAQRIRERVRASGGSQAQAQAAADAVAQYRTREEAAADAGDDEGGGGGGGGGGGSDRSLADMVRDNQRGAAEATGGTGADTTADTDQQPETVDPTDPRDSVTDVRGEEADPVPDRYEPDRTTDDTPPTDAGDTGAGDGTGTGAGAGDGAPSDLLNQVQRGAAEAAGGQTGGATPTDRPDAGEGQTGSPVPESTQGGLEETATGRLRELARDLETQALEQSGLESRGAFNVVREGDRLRVETTELGRRRLEEQAADRIERQLETTRAERAAQRARESGASPEQAAAVADAIDYSTAGRTLNVGDLGREDITRETVVSGPASVGGAASAAAGAGAVPEQGTGFEIRERYTLSESGRTQVREAQLEQATQLIGDQLPTDIDEGDVTRTESGGYTLSQQGRRELERFQERRQGAAEALGQYRRTEQVERAEASDEAIARARRRQFRQIEQRVAAKQRLREEAAQSYSERFGFDVPTSAVEISEEQRGGGRVLVPELDTEAAKQAGRGQTDALSGVVGATEYLVGKYTLFDPDDGGTSGSGSVVNVRRVEQFAGETEVTGGLGVGETQQRLRDASRGFSKRIAEPVGDVVSFVALGPAGLITRPGETVERVTTAAERGAAGEKGFFDALAGETEGTTQTATDRLLGGAGRGVVEIANLPAYGSAGLSAADFATTGAQRIAAGEGGEFATGAAASGASLAAQATEAAVENPAQTTGLVVGGVASGAGVGAVGKRAFTATRGRLATRGLRFQGDVSIEDIERPDVRSGQSQLTRYSERAVPEGDRSMSVEDFPAQPASDTAQELRNLAREFDDPQIRQALGAEADESVLFTARTGVKGERFEPRSGRPYDPDAAFFAGSVSRNFLNIQESPSASLSAGVRLPRPIAAARSLKTAAKRDGTPVIVATAGRVRKFPEDIVSARRDRRAMTEFLEEQADTGRFYTLRPEAGSGEAEALTAASGAGKTDPLPGAGLIDAGDATEFVEVARPLRTAIRGERVPIQIYRPDTGDVTPLSEQRSLAGGVARRIGLDDRGQVDLSRLGTGAQTRRTTTSRSRSSDSGDSYRPGGQPGTPFAPVSPFPPGGAGDEIDETAKRPEQTGPSSVAPSSDLDSEEDIQTATLVSGSPSYDPARDVDSVGVSGVPDYSRLATDVPTYGYGDEPEDETPIYDTPTYDIPATPGSPTTPGTPGTPGTPIYDIPTDDIPTVPDIPTTPDRPSRRPRFRTDDEDKRDARVEVEGELSKQFGGGIATDETVLTEDVTTADRWDFTTPFERRLDTDPSVDVVDVQGDPTPAELKQIEDLDDIDLTDL